MEAPRPNAPSLLFLSSVDFNLKNNIKKLKVTNLLKKECCWRESNQQPLGLTDPFPSHSLIRYFDKSSQPILLIFNSKQIKSTFYLVSKFEDNRSKIATVRVPHSKTYKTAAMTSSDQHFQNLRKVSSQNLVKIMWFKFHQNRSNTCSVQIKGCDRHTYTHTYTHTYRRTDRARSGLKYSVIWNDWI